MTIPYRRRIRKQAGITVSRSAGQERRELFEAIMKSDVPVFEAFERSDRSCEAE